MSPEKSVRTMTRFEVSIRAALLAFALLSAPNMYAQPTGAADGARDDRRALKPVPDDRDDRPVAGTVVSIPLSGTGVAAEVHPPGHKPDVAGAAGVGANTRDTETRPSPRTESRSGVNEK
jgi:hypothetical protein